MRYHLLVIGLTLLLAGTGAPNALGADRPAANARVARVIKAKRGALVKLFEKRGVSYPARRLFIRVFKREGVLELWADAGRGRNAKDINNYIKIKSYPICAASGALGPKRRQGDLQVPEGFYRVRVFNPWSAYHLSLGIDYPNRSDRVRGHRANLGGAIMLHGDCVSIGCVAITDALIEEVYLAAVESWHKGHKPVPVHIFPTRLDAAGITWLREHHAARPDLLAFWEELRPGFTHFEQHRTLPRIRVDRDGRYRVSAPRPTPVRPIQAERPGAPTTF